MNNENYCILTSDGELYHWGIKGMKWGQRRYQNKDGSLTSAGKKRMLMADYDNVGASKSLQNRHGQDRFAESKLLNKVSKATERLETRSNDPKYTNRQRAKDYETAIRGLSTLRDNQIMQRIDDSLVQEFDNRRLTKLKDKKLTDERRAKIEKLTTDSELMNIRIDEAYDKYAEFSNLTNRLVNAMVNDSAVVYNTRRRTHAYSRPMQDQYYSISNTDYKVRANTKSRSKSKQYTDPNKKKQYEDSIVKTTVYYY